MGFGFRKSKNFGGLRINVSKSGLGFSTGVKGLRVGVSGNGKTYIAGGIGGITYRKYGSSSTLSKSIPRTNDGVDVGKINSAVTAEKEHQTKSAKKVWDWWIFFFAFSILGVIAPNPDTNQYDEIPTRILWFIISSTIIWVRIEMIKKENNLIDVLMRADMNALSVELEKIASRGASMREAEIVAGYCENLIDTCISDLNIDSKERALILLLRKALRKEKADVIFDNIIDASVAAVIADNVVTEKEREFISQLLETFAASDEKRSSVFVKIEEINKIHELQKSGLKPIVVDVGIVRGAECFFSGSVTVLKRRTCKGEYSFEMDKSAQLYVTSDYVHIVSDGHKKIKMSDVLGLESVDGRLQISIANRQTPLFFELNESSFLMAVVSKLKSQSE